MFRKRNSARLLALMALLAVLLFPCMQTQAAPQTGASAEAASQEIPSADAYANSCSLTVDNLTFYNQRLYYSGRMTCRTYGPQRFEVRVRRHFSFSPDQTRAHCLRSGDSYLNYSCSGSTSCVSSSLNTYFAETVEQLSGKKSQPSPSISINFLCGSWII